MTPRTEIRREAWAREKPALWAIWKVAPVEKSTESKVTDRWQVGVDDVDRHGGWDVA